ncbi:MAG: type 1 glutamine amidotransferase [Patescibacteria group bacterium]
MKEQIRTLIIENAERRAEGIKELIKPAGGRGEISRVHLGEEVPSNSDFEAVIISGGSMGVYEMHLPQYDYLKKEADFIADMIAKDKAVLGICLGHQLLAHILGGEVKLSAENSEIGWSKIVLNSNGKADPLFSNMPDEFWSFQYHKDQVTLLPKNAINLAQSPLCEVQAFRYSTNPVWGIQFHPEISPEKARKILESRREELEKRGVDIFLAIRQGFSVSHGPRKQIFFNFINALR